MKLRFILFFVILLLFSIDTLRAQVITTIGGSIYGFAGAGGPATSAKMGELYGIALDNSGNTYTTDQNNNAIWKINSAGIISLYAGNGTAGYSGDGGPATSALLYSPFWMSIDNAGNIYFIDQMGVYIRKISPGGIISTIAGNPAAHFSGGDGGPLSSASFYNITGVVPDNAGNLYITDNATIRKVNSAGIITTIAGTGTAGFAGDGGPATAARFNQPYGVAIDNAGNIYIPDTFNERIRKIDGAGIITTIAGNGTAGYSGNNGPAVNASFNFPCAVSLDNNGNIYVVDAVNNEIRKIDNTGLITAFAGNHVEGYSGDGGPATSARISYPFSITCDNAGNIYFPDLDNYVVRKVSNCLTALVSLQPVDKAICTGGDATFTITATGAAGYQWQLNNGTGWVNLSDDVVYTGTTSNSLTVNSAGGSMNGYQYRCSVTNTCASIPTLPATLSVNTAVTSAVTVAVSPVTHCSGNPVTFTASPTNGGLAPSYQWMLNGSAVGTDNPVYINQTPVNGDIISCILTSNAGCLTAPTARSTDLTLSVSPVLTPALSIATPLSTICSGGQTTFTASPTNEGAAPTYQWSLNGNPVGTNSPSYLNSTLATGDVVRCVLTSSAACVSTANAASNEIALTVNPLVAPGITIDAPVPAICQGSLVSFTANPTNGGSTPSYQWLLNGNPIGTNSLSYASNTLINGDVVSCIMTSNAACLTKPSAVSNDVPVTLAPLVTPGISITGSAAAICAGVPVQFIAASTAGGPSPSYQWRLNGTNTGSNSPSYTNGALSDGDMVDCILTADAQCQTVASVISNSLVEKVNAAVNSSVSVAAPATSICAGKEVTFTATPMNGGEDPSFQWQINGNNVGSDRPLFTSGALSNGDRVSCILTSSLSCSAPVQSENSLIMTVDPIPVISMMPDTLIAFGQSVSLQETITGTIDRYEWTPVAGLDNSSSALPVASPTSSTTYSLTVFSDAGCMASGKVTIGVFKELVLPNAFTPNGDGKNDIFRIPPSLGVRINYFVIYDRWGERLFMTNNSGVGWDGTFGSHPEPTGTYVWQIEYSDLLTKRAVRISGTVILVR